MDFIEKVPASKERVSPTNGHPVQIVTVEKDDFTDGKKFVLDNEALEKILLDNEIRDKKVALVSVAGAFRKGKSFLLNFFLRYLESLSRIHGHVVADAAGEGSISGQSWLGDLAEPLEGFSWRGGSERETTGILLWSKPFFLRTRSGQEIAVLLMDTQGAFDSESTVKDCATVFALSTMLSSVQVFNLTQNIQEDDLQHLQLFTEYGRLALEEERSVKPFQRLHFLVRDWSYPYEYPYGALGGEQVLKVRLQVRERQHEELQQLRKHIRDCFEEISCFLMPHPGLSVATNPRFDGRLSEMEPVFREQLLSLIPLLLSPENLSVKRINGEEVTAMQLLEYVKVYVKIYQGDELPEPKSMLLATAEANNLAAVASSKNVYNEAMEQKCGGDTPYLAPHELEEAHLAARRNTLNHFNSLRKMGGPEYSASYSEQLCSECDVLLEHYRSVNQAKNVFVGARTPAVLLVISMLNYFLSGMLDFIGLDPVANVLTWMLWVLMLALATWCYVRYSGQLREVGQIIDNVAEQLWDKVICPLYIVLTQKAAEHATKHTAARLLGGNNVATGGQTTTSRYISDSLRQRRISSIVSQTMPATGNRKQSSTAEILRTMQ